MRCCLCQSVDLLRIFSTQDIPVFQNKVYATVSEAQNVMTGNVDLDMCSNCGFVFNAAFNGKVMSYDAQYQNEQAHSPYFQRYLRELVELFAEKRFQELKIIEIGCGKGYFLEMLLH